MFKNIKVTEIVSYLDKKLKEYNGEQCKYNNVTFEQCDKIVQNLNQDHTEQQLSLMEKNLEGEIEFHKQTGLKQTILGMWGSFIISFTVAVCALLSVNIQIIFNMFGKFHLDNSVDKQKAIDELTKLLKMSIKSILDNGIVPFFAIALVSAAFFCYLLLSRYEKKFKKRLFYNNLIKQCIELRPEKLIEEKKKDITKKQRVYSKNNKRIKGHK
ncbi:hypothetical protein ACFVWC_16535 [Bacillus mycoides]|uniref:hypothetical protein n=1 Tax=Bacillus mycoides TaxID=1405 RepID=UPI0036EA4EE4